jgi:haloalkane dehalogenase
VNTLRTPDERFAGLPDFDYEPQYHQITDQDGGALRIAWVEAGPADGEPVLLLHGEPSWSYLYRTMLSVLADAGLRAIAPDFVGFGRSDKPTRPEDHTYARHVEWLRIFVEDCLDLRGVTLVGQDWGGLIGLRVLAEHPDRFARLVVANTGLPTGDHPMPEIWHRFRETIQTAPEIDISRFVQAGCKRPMSDAVRAGYDAPFPEESYKTAARAFPGLVPTTPDDPATEANRTAWATLTSLDLPALVAYSDGDPITGPMAEIFRKVLPGARDRTHPVIENAGHFLQEDAGPELAAAIVSFIRETPAQ